MATPFFTVAALGDGIPEGGRVARQFAIRTGAEPPPPRSHATSWEPMLAAIAEKVTKVTLSKFSALDVTVPGKVENFAPMHLCGWKTSESWNYGRLRSAARCFRRYLTSRILVIV